jgi:hypothetical protein
LIVFAVRCPDNFFALFASLNLSNNSPSDEGIAALATSPKFSALRHLDLRANPLSEKAVQALANAPYWGRLERLLRRDTCCQRPCRRCCASGMGTCCGCK